VGLKNIFLTRKNAFSVMMPRHYGAFLQKSNGAVLDAF
jgi:hypothetical protein